MASDRLKVGAIGAGRMGRGIAVAFLDAGLPVTLVGRSDASLQNAGRAIAGIYEGGVRRGKLSEEMVRERLARLSLAADPQALAGCDLVVETISEDAAAKKEAIEAIDRAVGDRAIVVTNTSFLDMGDLARATTRPQNFAGMHFFNPANLMRLVENARPPRAAPDVAATLMAVAKRLGKTAVLVGRGEGFVANRMLSKRTREALFLLQEGATPAQVDRVLTGFGFPVGPFALADMAGLDVLAATRAARSSAMTPREREADIVERLVAAGRLGRKSGAGYYAYGEDGKPANDPAVGELLAAHRRERKIAARTVSDEEVRERCLLALVNEGAKLIEEGVAARAGDIDVIWTAGLGFPTHLGGPMFWASELGLAHVAEALKRHAAVVGPEYFAPSPLIERLGATGGRFA
jgi:3-hydroxyacyl-CoA dehydrogenase